MRREGVYKYPTIRLYQPGTKFVEYSVEDTGKNLNEKSFLEFLGKNGVNTNP